MSAAVAVNAHMRRASAVVVLAAAVVACAACGGQEQAVGARPATTQVPASEPAPAPSPEIRPASTPELEGSLFAAVRADDADAARAALQGGAALEAGGDGGRTPLVAAAKSNSVNTARVLVAAGADVNAKDDMEDSAFLYAGAEGYDEILALTLTLAHGADVSATNRFGGTALIPAAEHGHASTVRMLIGAGVPVNHVNEPGWTALQEAVVYGDGSARYLDVIGQLLAAGADPSIEDSDGRTALENAKRRDQRAVAALLGEER
ncbi:ankyrin repeat domain-containing protein [Rhodococcus maanshanensis]|uniref:ankyrin repeat domain-containing protein n=1 Tax=Rhodococcus maanshanensis TaxID=183556 RepID=UPI0022B3E4DB|nr:ankyrin repeat domain-containing protein [Rhodococcus maanshanensis]MCZ4555051.1 ankyrin repeat domain-containing protein [Rhodococcus maanshanensis]